MKAMILAAGVGSRLDPLTRSIPKPLVPILNRPVIEYLIELLRTHGFDEIVINTYYLGSKIEEYFGDGSGWGVKIHWSREDRLWGDAGSVKRMEEIFNGDTFLVIGGDDLTDMDLSAVLRTHQEKKATATLALSLVEDPSEFGIVMLDDNGQITRFLEKPKGEVFSNTANTGVYIFQPEVFDLIPPGEFFLFGKQLFPRLLERGLPMFGHVTTAYWQDVGNLKIYKQAQKDVITGKVKSPIPLTQMSPQIWQGQNVEIDPSATVEAPAVIGHQVKIGANTKVLAHCVIGNGCVLDSDVTLADCILWDGASVGQGTYLERCIVGHHIHVETNGGVFDGLIVNPARPEAPISA